ncbi:MAG TPA: type III pantothenate kinase [Verrucomicrobiae bacterium]|nr:type III pantothenate kinase [Verrucomicrobiae bacterium]
MLLTIDVGNTESKLGLFAPGAAEPEQIWRVTTEVRRTADEYGVFFAQLFATTGVEMRAVDAVAIASVVPRLDPVLTATCERFFKASPRFLRGNLQTLIPVLTDRPSEAGADLIAAAIGGRARHGAPLIVASYGTATVFIAVSPSGEYLGGAIAPGINTSLEALIARTAKLPQVDLDAEPEQAIGRNTVAALQSGLVFGYAGQTEAIVARMKRELGGTATVVGTGGLAEIVAKHTSVIEAVEPHLSLQGLALFALSS